MKPNTLLFILPAIRRALRSRTGVSCANSPRTMQIARRSPAVVCHLLCGFGLGLGAANTAFSQNGTYRVTEIVNPVPKTGVISDVSMNDSGTVTGNTLSDDRSGAARPPFVWLKNGTSQVLPTLSKTSGGGYDVGARVKGVSDSGLLVGYSPWFNGAHPIDQPARTAYWIPDSNGRYSVQRLDMGSLPPEIDGRVYGLSSDGRFVLFSAGGLTVVAELRQDVSGGIAIHRSWSLKT